MPISDRTKRTCPLCQSTNIADCGPVIHELPALVGGVAIDLQGLSFRLKRCPRCGFQFKDPTIPENLLLDCYRRSDSDQWGGPEPDARYRRYDLILKMLNHFAPGKRILDVGCSNGGFLAACGSAWRRFGIEPGRAAAAAAAERGIAVLGPTVESLDPNKHEFDVVTAIDVIEHLADPHPFLRNVSAVLAKGGILLIVTGDTAAWSWRFFRGLYWYVAIPEHTSFWSRSAVETAAEQYSLECVAYSRLSHHRQSWSRGAIELVKNCGYVLGRSLRGLGVPSLKRLFMDRGAPGWLSAADHMFCVMRKT